MRITVIYCGDSGAEYFNTASKEYEKRISAFSDVEVVKIRPEPLDENKTLSQGVIDKALDSEAEKHVVSLMIFVTLSVLITACCTSPKAQTLTLAEKL